MVDYSQYLVPSAVWCKDVQDKEETVYFMYEVFRDYANYIPQDRVLEILDTTAVLSMHTHRTCDEDHLR